MLVGKGRTHRVTTYLLLVVDISSEFADAMFASVSIYASCLRLEGTTLDGPILEQ
ncbi:hypothetical protein HanXRQr2_Chr08g0353071 [Helianthus annuus]|uniref:Uncharacterized protein n=1 Tax=Helianthus annuus TaxID=4232 RepID=A0A9K3NDL2_HELAN|nr:hypothetical protein HanXRQr2_Chr08g0353071 [Helianthus annuus]KAJ0902760.1 hypothetical protein HanPSC8_Chr08g0340921 [Helianthus annuus]